MSQGVFARGIDESWGNVAGSTLKGLGYEFVCLYLGSPSSGKTATRAKVEPLLAAGLQVVLVWEAGAQRSLSGFAAGVADAKAAAAEAVTLGQPIDRPIYFAVDFDMISANASDVINYFKGAALELGASRVGVYGGLGAVSAVLDSGAARWGWQTYAWSGGHWDSRAQLQQYLNGQTVAGTAVDLDRAMAEDFGGWGEDVPLTADDQAWIKAELGAVQKYVSQVLATTEANIEAKLGGASAGGAVTLDPATINTLAAALAVQVVSLEAKKLSTPSA